MERKTTGYETRDCVLRRFASSDPSRYEINAVCSEPDGTLVATDGHRLAFTCAADSEPQASAAPPSEALRFLDPSTLADVEKAAGKAGTWTLDAEGKRIQANNGATFDSSAEGREYPDWRFVVPAHDDDAPHAHYDAAYLRDLCDAAIRFAGKGASVRLQWNETEPDTSPLRVEVIPPIGAKLPRAKRGCEQPPETRRLVVIQMPERG